LILVHGAGGGAFEWVVWSRLLTAEGWSLSCPELMPVPDGLAATTYADYLDQVRAEVLQAPRSCVIIGASLGGLLALEAASDPQVVGLVLVNPLPPAPWQVALPTDTSRIKRWADTASLEGTARAVPDALPSTHEWLWRQWRNESGSVLREACSGRHVDRPECPSLVVIGESDTDVLPPTSVALADWLGAERLLLPGASHVGPLLGAHAAEIARRVHHWLMFRFG